MGPRLVTNEAADLLADRWMSGQVKASNVLGPDTWMGSLITDKRGASGQVYMRNRYYNPESGTFTQQDPIGLAGGLNVYGFADGDPVEYSDPYGLSAECPTCENRAMLDIQVQGVEQRTGRDVINLLALGAMAASAGLLLPEAGVALLGRVGIGAVTGGTAAGSQVFKNGERIQRFVQTSAGEVEVLAKVNIQDKVLHLDKMSVFPKFADKADVGTAGVRTLMRALSTEARAQGFETLRLTGARISGANPGRIQDIVIDLTK